MSFDGQISLETAQARLSGPARVGIETRRSIGLWALLSRDSGSRDLEDDGGEAGRRTYDPTEAM